METGSQMLRAAPIIAATIRNGARNAATPPSQPHFL